MILFPIDHENYTIEELNPSSIENNLHLFDDEIQEYINANNINRELSICLKDERNQAIVAFGLLSTGNDTYNNSVEIKAIGYSDENTKNCICRRIFGCVGFDEQYECLIYQSDDNNNLPNILRYGFSRQDNYYVRQYRREE